MSLPPTDIEPSALFLKLCEAPRPSELVQFPRAGVTERIRIQVLKMEEHDEARYRATDRLRKARFGLGVPERDDLKLDVMREVYGDAVAKEVLALACLTEKQIGSDSKGNPRYGRIFRGGEDLDQLTADEVTKLFASYELVQHKYGVTERSVTDEELNAWIIRLEAGASALPLGALPYPALADLTLSLAQRAYTLSAVLESLLSSLPSTLASDLKTYCLGITSSGEPAATSENSNTALSEPITLEQANKLAEILRARRS